MFLLHNFCGDFPQPRDTPPPFCRPQGHCHRLCAKLVASWQDVRATKNAKGKCNWLKVNKRQTGHQQTLGITLGQQRKKKSTKINKRTYNFWPPHTETVKMAEKESGQKRNVNEKQA